MARCTTLLSQQRMFKTAADYVQSKGLKLIGQPNDDFAWIHPRSAAGVLIQIVKDEA